MDSTEEQSIYVSKLLAKRDIDEKDEQEQRFLNAYKKMQGFIQDATEKEVHNILVDKVSESAETHSDVIMGLLYGILTETNQAANYFRYLNFIVRDSFTFCVSQLKVIAQEKYPKLLDTPRMQLLWLCKKLIELNVSEMDQICIILLRQISGGNVTQKNIWLVNSILQIFEEFKNWLYQSQALIPISVYTFLRLITDHMRQLFDPLREREVSLCVDLLRNKFQECSVIGRDLVRALQEITKTPEVDQLLKDMSSKPTSFMPNFTGIHQLQAARTPRVYSQCRVTPEMETQLMFLMKHVKMGNQKRYQQWFAARFLNNPESDNLVSDIIRFICCFYHPSNVVLSSDVIPRWAVIGWLLKLIRTPSLVNSAKMALLYDYFFFDPRIDNIMNIEPAMLLMYHSIPKYAPITGSILDFLINSIDTIDPSRKDSTRQCVTTSLKIMRDKGVVGSLAPLLACPFLDTSLIRRMRITFAPFYRELEAKGEIKKDESFDAMETEPTNNHDVSTNLSKKSSREDVTVTAITKSASKEDVGISSEIATTYDLSNPNTTIVEEEIVDEPDDMEDTTSNTFTTEYEIPSSLTKEPFGPTVHSFSTDLTLSLLEKLLLTYSAFVNNSKNSATVVQSLTKDLASFIINVIPVDFDDYSYQSLLSRGKNELLWGLFSLAKSNSNKANHLPILALLNEMLVQNKSIGLRFFCFSIADQISKSESVSDIKPPPNVFDGYLQFLGSSEANTIDSGLLRDMKVCLEENVMIFYKLIVFVYRADSLSNHSIGNIDIIHLFVSAMDSNQLFKWSTALSLGELKLIGTNIHKVITKSLQWESYEQFWFWQLVGAEFSLSSDTDLISLIIHQLDINNHYEALTGLVNWSKGVKPSKSSINTLLKLPGPTYSRFVVAILSNWSVTSKKSACKYISQFLVSDIGKSNKNILLFVLEHFSLWSTSHKNSPIWEDNEIKSRISQFIQSSGDESRFSKLLEFMSNNNQSNNDKEESEEDSLVLSEEKSTSKKPRKRLRKSTGQEINNETKKN